MSLQHIQKNSPRLLPKPAKFEKNPPNGYRVIRKTKCGAGGAGSSPIHKQASLAGRLIIDTTLIISYFTYRFINLLFYLMLDKLSLTTRLGQLGANISPDRSSLTPQVLIGNFLKHNYPLLYELQHINLLCLYLPKEDGVSPDAEYITQIIFSIFLQ